MQSPERFVLTQEHIDMLAQRRHLDTKFEAFMRESIADRRSIREELAGNTKMLNAVHIALFAKDDDNELGIAGLVVSMQRVTQHITVTCNIARFFKWAAITAGALATALIPIGQLMHWWGPL